MGIKLFLLVVSSYSYLLIISVRESCIFLCRQLIPLYGACNISSVSSEVQICVSLFQVYVFHNNQSWVSLNSRMFFLHLKEMVCYLLNYFFVFILSLHFPSSYCLHLTSLYLFHNNHHDFLITYTPLYFEIFWSVMSLILVSVMSGLFSGTIFFSSPNIF